MMGTRRAELCPVDQGTTERIWVIPFSEGEKKQPRSQFSHKDPAEIGLNLFACRCNHTLLTRGFYAERKITRRFLRLEVFRHNQP
jgi:hypothetical protein